MRCRAPATSHHTSLRWCHVPPWAVVADKRVLVLATIVWRVDVTLAIFSVMRRYGEGLIKVDKIYLFHWKIPLELTNFHVLSLELKTTVIGCCHQSLVENCRTVPKVAKVISVPNFTPKIIENITTEHRDLLKIGLRAMVVESTSNSTDSLRKCSLNFGNEKQCACQTLLISK